MATSLTTPHCSQISDQLSLRPPTSETTRPKWKMEPPKTPPKTPPNQILPPYPTTPPAPHRKTPPLRKAWDINHRDPLGPFYWESYNKSPDFQVPPLTGGDFRELPLVEELADQLGLKLPSGESILSRRPNPSELGIGAKLPRSIEEIDRLLSKDDEDPMSLSGMASTSEPKSKPGAFLKSTEGQEEKVDQSNSKLSSQKAKKSNRELGLMLPPPRKAPGGQQKKQIQKPSCEKSNDPKGNVGSKSQRLLKGTGAALFQEMASPQQAEEDRAKVFLDRLPLVQAASRRLQGQLGIHSDETWPLPLLPDDRNLFILETNAMKLRAALENCSAFAVTTDRESGKSEFLDAIVKDRAKRVVMQAGQVPKIRITSFENEKKASEASSVVARMMDEGLQGALRHLEDEGMKVPSTPKSLFHSVGPTAANSDPQTSQGSIIAAIEDEELLTTSRGSSSVDTEERERRERWEELTSDPHFVGIGPAGPEYDAPATPDPADRSDATNATPEWVYRENATPDPHYDCEGNSMPYNTSTASNDDQEMRTSTHETATSSAVSEHTTSAIAPPSQALGALSVYDSQAGGIHSMLDETMAVPEAQAKGKGKETTPSIGEAISNSQKANDKGKGKEPSFQSGHHSLYASQDQLKSKSKQKIVNFVLDVKEASEKEGKKMSLGPEMLDFAASLRNHSLTFVPSEAENRNPPVPQPEKMPNTLTEAICSYIPLEAKSILTLTLERVDAPVSSPTDQRCILLKHFEVGLDGVEGLCQGTAKIPETPEATAERERRVGRIGTFKQGNGGFYTVLKRAQQKEQQYGKGYWYFFGVKFKQTGNERENRKGGKWLLFGAPIEAVQHLDIKRNQENVNIMLGGGVDGSGTATSPFRANFKRTHTLFSRGGIAPMDIWPDGEDWDNGVFRDIRVAMAHNGLRVGFLYADTQTFPPQPTTFPAAGKNQDEKKRKQAGPNMTEEEVKAMEKSMKPKKSSDEEIGAILATRVMNDRAKQDAATARST